MLFLRTKMVVVASVIGFLAVKRPSMSTMSTAVMYVGSAVHTATPGLLEDLRALYSLNGLPTTSWTHQRSRRSVNHGKHRADRKRSANQGR